MIRRKILCTAISLFAICAGLFAKADTYIYDYWGEMEKSPDVYRVSSVVYAGELGLDKAFSNPSSLFCINDLVYLVDTGNDRIIEMRYTDQKTLELSRIIDHFNSDGQVTETFSAPTDVFVNKADGSFFVADTNNGRVVKLDKDLNYVLSFFEPDDPTYEKGKTFYPEKVIADSKGRAYVLAKNVNKGFLKYEYDASFSGFYGASEVTFNWTDYIWKKFATKAQRDQMESFVPTEYSNAYLDKEGFVFAVVKTFKEYDLKTDKAKPIRRLNALGDDILVKNSENLPIGDLLWGRSAGLDSPSHFNDITVLDNEVYLALDESRGRIFAYNNQGELLFAFGNQGNIEGNFRLPAAIDHNGRDLFVIDSSSGALTVFTPTEFGNRIYDATEHYSVGEYDASAAEWEKVLQLNGNYDLAYNGLGKARFRQESYKEAMHYFKVKRYKLNYSKAFMYYRKEWIERNLGKILVIVLVLILIPFIVKRVRAFVRELNSL